MSTGDEKLLKEVKKLPSEDRLLHKNQRQHRPRTRHRLPLHLRSPALRVRYGKEVHDAIVAKCLIGRHKTVEKSQPTFLLWVELKATEDAMEKAIENTVANAVVPVIDVVFHALRLFLCLKKKELEAELANVTGSARNSFQMAVMVNSWVKMIIQSEKERKWRKEKTLNSFGTPKKKMH